MCLKREKNVLNIFGKLTYFLSVTLCKILYMYLFNVIPNCDISFKIFVIVFLYLKRCDCNKFINMTN